MTTLPKLCEPPSLKAPVMASTGCFGFQASESTLLGGFDSGTCQGFRPARRNDLPLSSTAQMCDYHMNVLVMVSLGCLRFQALSLLSLQCHVFRVAEHV